MRINESGRSMIEMLGVLAIIGVLSVGGIAGYSKAMNKFKTNKTIDQVSMIVTNLRTLYAQQTTYNGLNNETAINMGVVPDEMINGTDINNPFDGKTFILAGATAAGNERAFNVISTGLSREACVAIAVNDWGSGSASGLVAIKAAGTNLTAADDATDMLVGCTGDATKGVACPGGSASPVPMLVARAATSCSCGTANTCSVVWKYF